MQIFLIQTIKDQIKHDFAFELIEAINYNNWFNNTQTYDYILCDKLPLSSSLTFSKLFVLPRNLSKCVPIGTVEFALGFLKKFYDIDNVKPVNIPAELNIRGYTKRDVYNNCSEFGMSLRLSPNEKVFVKSKDKIKGFADIIKLKDIPQDGNYMASQLIDIESEWRAFVYHNKLVGLQNYSGDFTMFPDVDLINEMIKDYNNCPPAYTLDVGINKEDGTFVIEVHNFFSCGLYGMSDHQLLPKMFIESFNYILNSEIKL